MFLVAGLVTDKWLSHNTPVVIGFFLKSRFLHCLPCVLKPLPQQPPIQSFLQDISILGGRWDTVVPHTNQRLSCSRSKCIAVLKIEMAFGIFRRGNSPHLLCKEITECCSFSYHLQWAHWLSPKRLYCYQMVSKVVSQVAQFLFST